jgi:hypothetical protein
VEGVQRSAFWRLLVHWLKWGAASCKRVPLGLENEHRGKWSVEKTDTLLQETSRGVCCDYMYIHHSQETTTFHCALHGKRIPEPARRSPVPIYVTVLSSRGATPVLTVFNWHSATAMHVETSQPFAA